MIDELARLMTTLAEVNDAKRTHRAYMIDPRTRSDKQLKSEARHAAAMIAGGKKRARVILTEILNARVVLP